VEAGVNRTVLIVDDSTSMRQIVRLTLQSAGFTVFEGSNGIQGLERLHAQPIQAVISDVNMPIMDGIAFLRAIRLLAEYRSIPVLMMTTSSQANRRQEGRLAGATGWIVKPFSPTQLLETLSKVLP
jgi:two-component system chemotaxis response regulator CheY